MQILGSKKGASQPQKPHIAKDDLNSTSFFKGLYGLCEGEIEGLADGGKSIKLDGTPLINANGQPNFKGVTWDFRSGTLDQSHISGFPAVENEQNIGVELRHDRPYTKAINNKELSAVRVRLNLNALREQKDNGDIVGYAIEYAIDLQTDTGAFVEVLRQPIRGKASNGFKRSHRIDLPPAKKGWTIRVRRITPNRDSDLVADTMTVDAITEIIDAKLAYPCTALLGLTYDAKTFSNIAKVAVRLKGKIIQVPTNYNPQTRQYTGLWDGTFKMAYSNNPAWVFYDLCTHRRYGLGERLNGMVDKWRLYQIGQYCDEMVDDGKGGKEPRFTVNVYIQKAEDAYKVLQNLASVFRGMSFWDGQNIIVDSDTPKDPVYTFSPANIIGGEFTYQGTRERDRHTFVRVAWDNPDNDFKTEYEPVTDEEAIATYGLKQLDINAFGCTSLGQAQRAGLWALKSEQLETRSVTFKTGLQGFIPQVGQVINIADDVFAGRAISGRIVNVNGKQITLDRVAGKVGDTLTVATADGVLSAKITAINGETLTLQQALNVENQSVWAIVADDLKLMQFRVLTIEQHDDATFSIHALQYEPQKFDAVDNGVHITPQPYTVLKATPIHAPNAVTLTSTNRTVQGQNVATLTINWEQVTGATAYIVEWRKDDGNWQTLPKVSGQSVDIDGVYSGSYTARVRAVDAFDSESLATTSQLTAIAGKTGKPPRLTRLTVQGVLFGMNLGWSFNKGSEDTNFTEIQVSPDGRSNITTLGTFAYPTNKHEITGLQGGLTQFYRGRIVDKLGNTSDWTAWVRGTTDNQAEKVLNLISGQINESHLHTALSTPIAKIGGLETAVNAVNGQLPTLNSQIATLNSKATTLQNELNTAKNTLQTATANITTERNRINTAIRDITTLQSANNAKTQEIANLVQTVGGHTSSIRELGVTTGDLNQKYTQLKTASDTANSEITTIKQTQAGQALSVERLGVRFDNLAVGGRNLLLNTQNPTYYRWANRGALSNTRLDISAVDNTSVGIFTAYQNLNLKQGQDYVISFDVDTDLPSLNYNFILENDGNIRLPSSNIKQGRVVIKYTPSRDLNNARFLIGGFKTAEASYLDVKNIKLETGQVATDWTPAPEDLQADIDSKATTANLETLRQTLTNADTALSQQITAMDTAYKSADRQLTANLASEQIARTSADTALGQRIDSLQSDYNGNKASVANQLKTLSDKDTATASQISQLTANVTTAQNTATTANGKADTATTKADNAQNTANNALNRANTANSAITAEQKARADADTALGQRITAIDTAYKSADSQTVAKLGQIEQSISDKDRAMSQRVDTLNANYTALDNRTSWTELTTATDLNNLTETGKYFIRASSNPNAPFLNWAYVVVEKARADRITQTAWADNNASLVFIRVYNGAWQAWEKTATGKELRDKASTAQLNELKQTSANADTALGERITAIDTAYKQADTATNAKLANAEKAISDNNTALSQRITALDTAYKSADNNLTARLAREETARASGDNANAQALRTLESTVNGIGGRVGTSESKIATLERTTSDTNQALATAQSQMNARFDSLAVGGRNLILGSQVSRNTHGTTALTISQNIDYANLTNLVLSVDVVYKNASRATTQGAKWFRIGAEIRLVYTDGSTQWFGAWTGVWQTTSSPNFNGRVVAKFSVPAGKTVRAIDNAKIQIWDIVADEMLVKNPKLEIGNIATDWTPAPEDVNVDLSPYATNATLNEFKRSQAQKDTATAQKLSQLETGLGTKANTIALDSLSTKVNQVDGKITAEAQKVSTLQTTVNGQTTSIQQQATSIDGLKAQYTVKLDSGGRVSGFGLASGGDVSDFSVRADKFLIAPPSGNGKGDSPFMVLTKPTNINGTVVPSGTYIKDAYIANGSIDVAKINKASITSLSALTANIGHFKSAETGARLEIKDSVLLVYDDNNRLRVRLGVW